MVKNGQIATVHYTGTLDDLKQFDSSVGREPLQFEVGAGRVIPGFENGVKTMSVGEKKTIHIPVAEAYGERSDEMVMDFDRTSFPEELDLKVGMGLQMQDSEGQVIPVVVMAVNDKSVTIDANHPLAGKNLNFELELIEVV